MSQVAGPFLALIGIRTQDHQGALMIFIQTCQQKKNTHILLSLGERFVYQEVRLWCEQNINCNLRN